jgi:hypothetical protein
LGEIANWISRRKVEFSIQAGSRERYGTPMRLRLLSSSRLNKRLALKSTVEIVAPVSAVILNQLGTKNGKI